METQALVRVEEPDAYVALLRHIKGCPDCHDGKYCDIGFGYFWSWARLNVPGG